MLSLVLEKLSKNYQYHVMVIWIHENCRNVYSVFSMTRFSACIIGEGYNPDQFFSVS